MRTRQVRALTEKFYGRVARLFVLKGDDALPEELRRGVLAATMLRQAADELSRRRWSTRTTRRRCSTSVSTPAARRRFEQRLNRLTADLQRADDPEGGELRARVRALPGTDARSRRPADDA